MLLSASQPGTPPHRPHSPGARKGTGLETSTRQDKCEPQPACRCHCWSLFSSSPHQGRFGRTVRALGRGVWLLVLSLSGRKQGLRQAAQNLINNTGKMVSLQSGCESSVT